MTTRSVASDSDYCRRPLGIDLLTTPCEHLSIVQRNLKHETPDSSCAGLGSRSSSFTQRHRQFLCYLDGDGWTPASKLPPMPRTARALLREGLVETMVIADDKLLYRITRKRLAAPRR